MSTKKKRSGRPQWATVQRRHRHGLFVWACLFGVACGDEPAHPTTDPTSGSERSTAGQGGAVAGATPSSRGAAPKPRPEPPLLPEPFEASFTLPIRVPLSLIAERIEAELPAKQAQGWQPLTRPGKSPALEARYELWRDPVKVRFDGGALHVEVPLRYAARFNAKVKNPFGGRWLTLARDQAWGTRGDPQRVVLRSHTRVEITRDWQLKLHTRLDPPEHGPPPAGKLCTPGGFKLCVTRASVAPALRKRLDAEILPRLERAAADADRRVTEMVALRSRLQGAWEHLTRPIALGDRWLRVEPRAAALELRGEPMAVVLQPAIAARISHHTAAPPASPPPALPPRSPLSALPGERLELPPDLAQVDLLELLRR